MPLTYEERQFVILGQPDPRHGHGCRCEVCDPNHPRRYRPDVYGRDRHDIYCRCRACDPVSHYR